MESQQLVFELSVTVTLLDFSLLVFKMSPLLFRFPIGSLFQADEFFKEEIALLLLFCKNDLSDYPGAVILTKF